MVHGFVCLIQAHDFVAARELGCSKQINVDSTALVDLQGATVVDQAVTISAAEESDSPAMSHPAVTPSEHAHATELPVSCTSSLCMSTY
jgi:hypothetical protein